MENPKVAILMGSSSDADVVRSAAQILDDFGVCYEMLVLSAHRTPHETAEYAAKAEERGIQVLIAAAGMAAHLAGALAAHSTLPVLGIPLSGSSLKGLDALLSTAQMPGGVPVATMSLGKAGAKNAGLFAVQILSRSDSTLNQKFKDYREKMRENILSISL